MNRGGEQGRRAVLYYKEGRKGHKRTELNDAQAKDCKKDGTWWPKRIAGTMGILLVKELFTVVASVS